MRPPPKKSTRSERPALRYEVSDWSPFGSEVQIATVTLVEPRHTKSVARTSASGSPLMGGGLRQVVISEVRTKFVAWRTVTKGQLCFWTAERNVENPSQLHEALSNRA